MVRVGDLFQVKETRQGGASIWLQARLIPDALLSLSATRCMTLSQDRESKAEVGG